MTDRKRFLTLGVAIFALLMIVYHKALRIPYFGDDFQWYFPHPGDMLFGNFFHRAPDNDWYRPLQSSVLAIIQLVWGADTLPIRIWHLLLQTSLSLLVYRCLRYWKVSVLSATIASVYFAVMQAGTFAVICNDTMSQMMGAAFGAFTLWNLYRGMELVRKGFSFPFWRLYLCIVTFILSLVSKETSAGLCLSVFFLVWMMEPDNRSFLNQFWLVLKRVFPFVLMGVLYVVLRFRAGSVMPSYGGSLYQVHFGLNIFKNIGLFLFQSILPFSSASVMRSIYMRNFLLLAILVSITLLLLAAVMYGIRDFQYRSILFSAIGIAFSSLMPAIFLNHVSEVYLYNALPYMAVVIGIATEFYLRRASVAPKAAFGLILSLAFIANVYGAVTKTASLAEESDRGQILMSQIYPIVRGLPQHGRLYLVNPIEHEFEYSVFAMKGFGPVEYADPWILRHTSRPDVTLYVLDSTQYADSAIAHPGTAYTMDRTTLQMKPFVLND